MSRYQITTKTELREIYVIEADTVEEAKTILLNDEYGIDPVESIVKDVEVVSVDPYKPFPDTLTIAKYDGGLI